MANHEQLIMIAGPCAAESHQQVMYSAEYARERGIKILRACIDKPRTMPGFEGHGNEAISWLFDVAQMGLTPATEVLLPKQAEAAMNGVLGKDSNTNLLLWLGSRNQNHQIQRAIGESVAGESRVKLMIKNQMWPDKNHWIGIVKHVLDGGATLDQIWLCHRGFAPSLNGYRNPPNLQMALEIQHSLWQEYGVELPLIGDPSHIAGHSADNVIAMAKRILDFHWESPEGNIKRINGLITEVHSNPQAAMTDNDQQLTWEQFDKVLEYASQIKTMREEA